MSTEASIIAREARNIERILVAQAIRKLKLGIREGDIKEFFDAFTMRQVYKLMETGVDIDPLCHQNAFDVLIIIGGEDVDLNPIAGFFILLESGDKLLKEDGGKLLTEN